MPKVRYPVLVREQKAAVMRVRCVNLVSTPFPIYSAEDQEISVEGRMFAVELKTLIVPGYGDDTSKLGIQAEVISSALWQTVVEFFPSSDDAFGISGQVVASSLWGTVVEFEFIDQPYGELQRMEISGSVVAASLYGNLISTVQDFESDSMAISRSIVGATLT